MPFVLEFIGIFEFRFMFVIVFPFELFLPVFEFIGVFIEEGEDVAIGAGDAEFELVT